MLQAENPSTFRQYIEAPTKDDSPIAQRVHTTYKQMHTYQCVDFVRQQYDRWLKFDHSRMSIYQALEQLNGIVDESDPDVDVPNIYHAYQTAEAIRKVYPEQDWFQLTGLIHDCGKVLALYNEPQWAVVGDTFPVGCQFSEKIVYHQTTFDNNPDLNNEIYSTKYGMYSPNCGLNQCLMSWGHDEYLYRVLNNHSTCTLPDEALYIIRYHSFYPW
jgi:inositol oxygenase